MSSEPEFLARDGWKHADKWTREGKHFCVQVTRHSTPEFDRDFKVIGSIHRWCVYLYVYPKHPDFERFDIDHDNWPYYECHSYVSLNRANYSEKGDVTSYQLGWDYSHDGDSQYEQYANAGQAGSVFYDASRVFDEAMARAAGEPA